MYLTTSSTPSQTLPRRLAIAVFAAFALAYFFSALIRAITATLAPTLTQEFSLSAAELGLLSGGYFLGFAMTQLPLGNWLDRYGPRRVLLCLLSVAVLGCVAFAAARSFGWLLAARVLCGVGVSACLMAPLTGYRRWLDAATQLRANSWMLMTGSLGMVASTLPVQWWMEHSAGFGALSSWRGLFLLLALAVALSMLVLWRVVPAWRSAAPAAGDSTGHGTGRGSGQNMGYAQVWAHPYFRRYVPLGFFSYGGLVAVQTLWAGPWLVKVSGYTPAQAAQGLFVINVCMLLAFWVWGAAAPRLVRRGLGADRLIAWGLPLNFIVLAIILVAGSAVNAPAWAVFCVTNTFVSLSQPAIGMAFPAQLAGRALSAYNLVIFSGVFCVQWGIGLMVDGFERLGWSATAAFQGAFAVYGLCCVLSYLYFAFYRDNSAKVLSPS
jgi:predicted MFS family arabinose efflux permease